MIASVPAVCAHELADEAPGLPASRCPDCGAALALRPICPRCEDSRQAHTLDGRVLASLRAWPNSSRAQIAASTGLLPRQVSDSLARLKRRGRVVGSTIRQWRAL